MKKLAIFGGTPAFEQPLYVGRPFASRSLQEQYFHYMDSAFGVNWFTNDGPLVQKLEEEIAELHGVAHCVCVCNATVAMILLLKALDLHGEIIIPSFTFVATAHACLWQNLDVRFCDIEENTLMMDPQHARSLINENTCAILGVHLFGNLCHVAELDAIAQAHTKHLLFDAAHSFACTLASTPVGAFGHAEVFSFHATKFFSTFEGGAILTNDTLLDNRLRLMRNFGFSTFDTVDCLGINGKMPEACAAMGLASMQELDERRKKLELTYRLYREACDQTDGTRLLPVGEQGTSNYHSVVVLVDESFGVSRDALCQVLWKENVIARRYFYPGCHRMEPYRTRFPDLGKELPVTERVCDRVLSLPTNLDNPERDVQTIMDVLRETQTEVGRVTEWVQHRNEQQ